jgi:hypothetical protein
MPASVTIKGFKGAAQYIKALPRVNIYIKREFASMGEMLHRIVNNDIRETFRTEGGNIGKPWPDVSIRTMAERMKAMFPPAHPIHERTGSLKRTMGMPSGVGPGQHDWITVKSANGFLCRLEVNPPAKLSHPYNNFSGNLVDMLHKGSQRRPARPLYDEGGYGVSSKCVDEIYDSLYNLVDKTLDVISSNAMTASAMDDRFDFSFVNKFGETKMIPGTNPGYYY